MEESFNELMTLSALGLKYKLKVDLTRYMVLRNGYIEELNFMAKNVKYLTKMKLCKIK